MGRIIFFIYVLLAAIASAVAQTDAAYEWWIDDDYAVKVSGALAPQQTKLSPDMSGLDAGFHFFNLRVRNSAGVWGSVYRKVFFKPLASSENTVYEYWIDDDYAGKVSGALDPQQTLLTPDMSALAPGLHFFNLKVRNSALGWGSVYRKIFFKPLASSEESEYEYWIDDDYANKTWGKLSPDNPVLDIDMSRYAKEGVHLFNFRLRNYDGGWGSIYRKGVYVHDPSAKGDILGYRHALNSEELGYVKVENPRAGIYSFVVDLADGSGIRMEDLDITFDGDRLSVAATDPISYRIQIESDRGWSVPVSYAFDAEVNFSTTAQEMAIPSSITFQRPLNSEFKAVKFTSNGGPLYAGTDRLATMDIYRNGKRLVRVPAEELMATKVLSLEAGTYYAVIYNVAKSEGSSDVTLSINTTILDNVGVAYDGHYVTLTPPAEGAEIFYTLDGSVPDTGISYEKPFDVGGLCTIRTFARKGADYVSARGSYEVCVYADTEHAETSAPGFLASGFGWDPAFATDVEAYRIEGPLDEEDFKFVRTMKSLRHLDLEKVNCSSFPDSALAGTPLVSVSLPSAMTSYGDDVFSGCGMLSAVICNSPQLTVDRRLTSGVENPNLLIYITYPLNTVVQGTPARNIVKGNYADRLDLTDACPFYAPREFTALQASYVRNFTKTTAVNGCSGWETLALPFDVQKINDSHGEISPFAAAAAERMFWLYTTGGIGWERTDAIRAYVPYIIAMPNNLWYDADAIISGDVTFRSDNVMIGVTPSDIRVPYREGLEMAASYRPVSSDAGIYAINDEEYGAFAPGEVFVGGLRDIRPFECYLTGTETPRMIPVMDSAAASMPNTETALMIWPENGTICVLSVIDMRVPVYNMMGQLLRVAQVKAGEVCRIGGLTSGMYIVADKKIVL